MSRSTTQGATYRAAVAGFANIDRPMVVRGEAITGAQLTMMIAINPEIAADEAWRTPQLISELGRVLAAALYEKEMAEIKFRVWRDTESHKVTTDVDYAIKLKAVTKDSTKPLAKTAAEDWTRTRPDYLTLAEAVRAADEAYNTIAAAYEAAKARTRAIENYLYQGGSGGRPPRPGDDDHATHRHGGHEGRTYEEVEREVAAQPRTPLPHPSTVPVGGPPPAPSRPMSPPPPPPPSKRS